MGLLITLYLITCNVYGSTKAPTNRGFSYIEVWIIGVQLCILMAVFEYAILLTLKRLKTPCKSDEKLVQIIDVITLIISATFFSLFNIIYWLKCNDKWIKDSFYKISMISSFSEIENERNHVTILGKTYQSTNHVIFLKLWGKFQQHFFDDWRYIYVVRENFSLLHISLYFRKNSVKLMHLITKVKKYN